MPEARAIRMVLKVAPNLPRPEVVQLVLAAAAAGGTKAVEGIPGSTTQVKAEELPVLVAKARELENLRNLATRYLELKDEKDLREIFTRFDRSKTGSMTEQDLAELVDFF